MLHQRISVLASGFHVVKCGPVKHVGAMDDKGVCSILDLDAVVCPKERTEAVGACIAFGGDGGYVAAAAERVVRVGVAFSAD